jgi:hypothetical protein
MLDSPLNPQTIRLNWDFNNATPTGSGLQNHGTGLRGWRQLEHSPIITAPRKITANLVIPHQPVTFIRRKRARRCNQCACISFTDIAHHPATRTPQSSVNFFFRQRRLSYLALKKRLS